MKSPKHSDNGSSRRQTGFKGIKDYKKLEDKSGYIYKPVYGRVGEKIAIKESCTKKEYKQIMTEVKLIAYYTVTL